MKLENKIEILIFLAQIINQDENKNMPSSMGLDEKVSDLVGTSKFEVNDNLNLSYNFAIDQNYSDFNYNEISASANFDKLNFNVDYLEEKKHIGNAEYVKSKIGYKLGSGTNLSYEFKKKLNRLLNFIT